jgi:tetratricopeptide (TPR) repeat protein
LISYIEAKEGKKLKEHAEVLCLKGTSNSFKGDTEAALNDYQEALGIYRQIYGSDHNRASAIAIGNLARVYTNAEELETAENCLNVSMNILKEIGGQNDPDYVHFSSVLDKLHKYKPT